MLLCIAHLHLCHPKNNPQPYAQQPLAYFITRFAGENRKPNFQWLKFVLLLCKVNCISVWWRYHRKLRISAQAPCAIRLCSPRATVFVTETPGIASSTRVTKSLQNTVLLLPVKLCQSTKPNKTPTTSARPRSTPVCMLQNTSISTGTIPVHRSLFSKRIFKALACYWRNELTKE